MNKKKNNEESMSLPNLFITVTTQAGIPITQFGQLSGGESSTQVLIGGSITALRGIVSTETTNVESRFMTGSTEHSNFGTFTIRLDEENALELTYILTSLEEEMDLEVLPLVQITTRAFGYQLLQTINLENYIRMGKQIDPIAVAIAFINAATVGRLQEEIHESLNEKILESTQQLKVLIKQSLDKFEEYSIYKELRQTKNRLIEDQYWNQGFLSWSTIKSLSNEVVEETLWKLININPLYIILSEDPRFVRDLIEEELKQKKEEFREKYSQQILSHIERNYDRLKAKVYENIKLSELHITQQVLRERTIRETIFSLIQREPFYALISLEKTPIIQALNNLLEKERGTGSIAEIIRDALVPHIHPRILKYIDVFLTNFMKELQNTPLTEGGWQIISSFLATVIDKEELIKVIKEKFPTKKEWHQELKKNLKPTVENKLPIYDMEEAKALWLALGVSGARAIATLIVNEFYSLQRNHFGFTIRKMVEVYHSLGEVILSVSLLHALIKKLKEVFPFEARIPFTWLIPTSFDLFIAFGLERGILYYEEEPVAIRRKFLFFKDKWVVKTKTHRYDIGDLARLKEEKYLLNYKDRLIPYIEFSREPKEFLIVRHDSRFLEKAILYAFRRKFLEIFSPLLETIENLEWVLKGKTVDKKAKLSFPKLELEIKQGEAKRDYSTLPEYLLRENKGFARRVMGFYEKLKELENLWNKYSKGSVKDAKLAKEILKQGSRLREEIFKEFEDAEKWIEKTLKKRKKEVLQAFSIEGNNHIMRFQPGSIILPNEQEIAQSLKPLIDKECGVFRGDATALMSVAISVVLFNRIPEKLLGPALSEFLMRVPHETEVLSSEIEDLMRQNRATMNDVINSLSDLVNMIEKSFINRDAPIIIERDKVFIELFTERLIDFPNEKWLVEVYPFERLIFEKEAGLWMGRIHLADLAYFKSEIPILVSLSDVIRYITLREFREVASPIFSGVGLVIQFIEKSATNKLNLLKEDLEDTVFVTR